jgi:hypothetical protein
MRTHLKKTLLALPVVGLLGIAPLGYAHEGHEASPPATTAVPPSPRAPQQNLNTMPPYSYQTPMSQGQHRHFPGRKQMSRPWEPDAEHNAQHRELSDAHEAMHEYPMTERQHRRLHRQLNRAHERGHRDLNNEWRDYTNRDRYGDRYADRDWSQGRYDRDYYGPDRWR